MARWFLASRLRCGVGLSLVLVLALPIRASAATLGGPLPGPLPLFPATNWWNLDISSAPVDPGSANFITFVGPNQQAHPDFGGEESAGSAEIYGFPYVVVNASQAKKAVHFFYWDESDGVNQSTHEGIPFYPIPDEAITQAHWIEGGPRGNIDLREDSDRHILIVDQENKHLYELYNVYYDGTGWQAGSGAFFDMNTNNRRPEGWTSADAAGLAILPGLVRYDEAYGTSEIAHAFRVTVRDTNGHVYPASHTAGSASGALPMGARLRLKQTKNIDAYAPEIQRIFRAMKKYGLIVADNGTDMYVSGTFDTRWDNDVLNPAFHSLKASDFEVVQLGWNPTPGSPSLTINDVSVTEGNAGTKTATFTVSLSAASTGSVTVNHATANGTATAGSDYVATSGALTFPAGTTSRTIAVTLNGDTAVEANETFVVNLSGAAGATLADAQGQGTIQNDDAAAGPSLSLSATTVGPGQTVTVTVANGPGNPRDWVGLHLATGPDSSYSDWKYLNGTRTFPTTGLATASVAFTMPGAAGSYNFRLFANGGFSKVATSATVTVQGASSPTLSVSTTSAAPGQTVQITVAGGPGNRTDWVGMHALSAADTAASDWKYLNGTRSAPVSGLTSATLSFTLPTTPGTYDFRFFQNNSYTRLARSTAVIVTGSTGPTVTLGSATVAPGQAIQVTVANGPGNPRDWLGLHASTAPDTTYLDWKYLNGTRTSPTIGLTAAVVTFAAPTMPGTYTLRLFANGGFSRLATSATLTVQSTGASLLVSATTVAPGGTVQVTVQGGPGSVRDWVGLHVASAGDTTFLDWKYLSGTRTLPASGMTTATLSFTLPTPPGSYQFRLFANGGYTRLATSVVVTVQ